ncbi:hypothetical protein M011DRAFT_469161 [Sporormia fimetaria CBS 119925]|uniref:Uncharacterized protein n=1 Tax=Sporormia fimetaria CBS 119925 TaxID=1340428 RepID=A0A6A6V759_9PLEO|nr:hypothetical protein M011DRAFT_469161 [Sporormia fimetaria CBS 119925]
MLDPTPMRIRGRKRNRSETPSTASSRSTSIEPSSKRFRASKPVSKRLTARRRIRTMASTPTLQGLPQELLEMIFLHSMNMSLPRASPDIGRKLSSRSICMEFCLRTFFDTVDHKSSGLEPSVTADPELQSQLLACRFFTWKFFLAYVDKAREALIKLRGNAWAKTGIDIPGSSSFEHLQPFRFTKIKYLGLAEGFHIPEKLLHNHTPDKSNLLYVLVCFHGQVDWNSSMAGETAKEGMMEAITANNERGVAALAVLLGVAGAITTETLLHAVVRCGCNLTIMRHLLYNAQVLHSAVKGGLDFYDDIMWHWIDTEGVQTGKGEILKNMLREANGFRLKAYPEDEMDWKNVVHFPYTGEKFDARAGFNFVLRELFTRLYRNHGRRMLDGRARRPLGIENTGGDQEGAAPAPAPQTPTST